MLFPDARTSLPRITVSAQTKIPLPVAITLHNFIPPSPSNTDCSSFSTNTSSRDTNQINIGINKDAAREKRGMWVNRQPQHESSLLPPLKLEITANLPYKREQESGDDSNKGNHAAVVYSGFNSRTPSVHPSWEHIDERIYLDHGDCWNQNKVYRSMKVMLSVVSESREKRKQHESTKQALEGNCFLKAFLHPSFLERIDIGSNNNSKKTKDTDRHCMLPPGLPNNAMIVHFSDGSIRCPPQTLQILRESYGCSHRILGSPPFENFSRFEDDAFATLDHVRQIKQRPRIRSISSLLDQDHNYSDENDNHDHNQFSVLLRHEVKSSLPDDQRQQEATISIEWICREERMQDKLNLIRLIAEEERALEEDLDRLRNKHLSLTMLMSQIQIVEHDILKVKAEFCEQSLRLKQGQILKKSQCIKLFRGLRDIYPIALDSVSDLILGLRLPEDVYTTSILEEEVNTSLGYCAHLIYVVAKYLAVQLRHRIFCNGSRSAIELDGVGILPLFLGRLAARTLEREQVDRGARLLGVNADCVLVHISKSPLQKSSFLAKLQMIVNLITKGKITD